MEALLSATPARAVQRLDRAAIEARLKSCARLPSLGSINSALRELLSADQRYTTQISEVIRRDPSLTARLLRLVNSVYFGLTTSINSIEEAVFYLGVRQIRQLAMVTPVIEDFQRLAGNTPFAWREFWRHCIGVAIMTREVITSVQSSSDEADYVAGLVHDVGKIVMASGFPDHFAAIYGARPRDTQDILALEADLLGMNHCELGAIYLKNHNLPSVMIDTARFHHRPSEAAENAPVAAAVQVADLLVRSAGIGNSGNPATVAAADWVHAEGWKILLPQTDGALAAAAHASLKRSLDRLPLLLEGLI